MQNMKNMQNLQKKCKICRLVKAVNAWVHSALSNSFNTARRISTSTKHIHHDPPQPAGHPQAWGQLREGLHHAMLERVFWSASPMIGTPDSPARLHSSPVTFNAKPKGLDQGWSWTFTWEVDFWNLKQIYLFNAFLDVIQHRTDLFRHVITEGSPCWTIVMVIV